MAGALTDEQVRQTGLAALEGKLGAVDALRFLALLAANYREIWCLKTGLRADFPIFILNSILG